MKTYPPTFFAKQQHGARRSADTILPLIQRYVTPSSVVDVGCGTGAWLAAWHEQGVDDIFGIDGDYVQTEDLLIPAEKFKAYNLEAPFDLGRTFDLALCLEVAEHLAANTAQQFIASLTNLAPVIVFSAAVPGQGGVNHVNEQWPQYWADLFAQHGFTAIDCLREQLWLKVDVQWWYAQNMLFFAHEDYLRSAAGSRLEQEQRTQVDPPLPLVHPELYAMRTRPLWHKLLVQLKILS